MIRALYQRCRLVHADLSEYNVLVSRDGQSAVWAGDRWWGHWGGTLEPRPPVQPACELAVQPACVLAGKGWAAVVEHRVKRWICEPVESSQ